jgi:hypothetical protein
MCRQNLYKEEQSSVPLSTVYSLFCTGNIQHFFDQTPIIDTRAADLLLLGTEEEKQQ